MTRRDVGEKMGTPPQDLRRTFVLYFLTGGSAALVDLGTFYWLSADVRPIILAAAASFAVAATFNYLVSSLVVYRTSWQSFRRATMFLTASGLGLAINATTTAMLVSIMPISPVWAKIAGIGLAFGANFALNTFVVFRNR
jgi:putative flippase GtrA